MGRIGVLNAYGALAATMTAGSSAADDLPIVTPSPRQIAWQESEFAAFVHFGINTFTDREWGDGREDPKLFNPTAFDAGQWVRVFKAMGMKQLLLTCKHHDGFCLWPSKYTEHSVKSSPWRDGKGDVVREVSTACREAGLKFGVYLSPWDRHEPSYGDSPRYNEFYKNQLTELLTGYGPIHEVWFDGACGVGPNGKRQEYDWEGYIEIIRRIQPEAVIFSDAGPDVRWVGNENGVAGETNWSMLRRAEFYPGTPNYKQLTEGHEDGTHWVPAECDVSIRRGWFHHPAEDDHLRSVEQLLDIYYDSVGRNAVLLLNVPPDRRGLIHEKDVAWLAEVRRVLDTTFKKNLAAGKSVAVGPADEVPCGPFTKLVTDGDARTSFAGPDGVTQTTFTVELDSPRVFNRVLLQEDIRQGQRVREFVVEVQAEAGYRSVVEGTTIGHKRLLRFPQARAERVRLRIRSARAAPVISEIQLFDAERFGP